MKASNVRARASVWLGVALGIGLLQGCATMGQDFPVNRVGDLQVGVTTQRDVQGMFGAPWRVGIESGRRTWTYGKYKYNAFGDHSTQDLVIRFDAEGRVASYTFNTTEHDLKQPRQY